MSYVCGTTDTYMHGTANADLGDPIALFCWVKVIAQPFTEFDAAVCVSKEFNGSLTNSYMLRTSNASNAFHARSQDNTTGSSTASATKSGVAGVWTPWLGLWLTGDSDRECRIGDVSGTNGADRFVDDALREITIASNPALAQQFDGKIAEVAIWTGTLPDATDWTNLQAGLTPGEIRPGALRCFYPFDTDTGATVPNLGLDTGGDLDVVGVTFDSDHPVITHTGGGLALPFAGRFGAPFRGLLG